MAEVNGTDHLVRHEKETKANGYDNDGFHPQERSEDEEESASDDDRLRVVVVTENGHRPEELSNGYVHEETNGHSTAVNGSAVIVVEDDKGDTNTNDSKDSHSQKPLDTRLHHFVPVDDMDRKILNGSDGTHVTIPEDAVISFSTGRVKVKKGSSNNAQNSSERESIPLETMLPSYEAEDKIGLGEKAELEAELANHKNGLWSEGHNAYRSSEGPFGNSEKLNGTSKSNEEVSLPVNNHRKCLSNDVSDTSSELKSTGEKLYFTEENRKLCPGWRRVFVCGLILIILAVALLLGVLAATGILLAESESKSPRYESGHSLPSIDSVNHAGVSFRPRPSSSKVPQKSLPSVTGGADLLPNSTIDIVSRPSLPTVSSKVPVLNDSSSHSQTIVPNALVGEFTIDENFTDDLKDNKSNGYQTLAKYIERELHGIFKRNGGIFEELKILNFMPGSIKVKFVTIWASDHNIILSQKAVNMMKSYLRKNHNSLLAYPVDLNSIHFTDVFDECKVQQGGCSYGCIWDYNTLTKTCTCEDNMMLLVDGKSCGPKPISKIEATTSKISLEISTTTTKQQVINKGSSITTTEQPTEVSQTTTIIPTVVTKAIASISELFNNLTTTQSPSTVKTFVTELQKISSVENLTSETEITTEHYYSTEPNDLTTKNTEVVHETTTKITSFTSNPSLKDRKNDSLIKESGVTENLSFLTNISSETTTAYPNPETTLIDLPLNNSNNNKSESFELSTVVPVYNESQSDTTTEIPLTKENTDQVNLTTIGYHIKEETTEIYTLKENDKTDIFTTPESTSTAEDSINTSHASNLNILNEKTTFTPEFITTTESPDYLTKDFPNTSEVTEYETTIMPEITETTITTKDHSTTEVTKIGLDTQETTYVITTQENEHIIDNTVTPMFDSEETIKFEDNATTLSPFVTTISKIFPGVLQSNKTPEVRSFDDDFENETTSILNMLSTNESSSNSVTDATISSVKDDSLSLNPVTTPLPNVTSMSETTLAFTTPDELTNSETTTPATWNMMENGITTVVEEKFETSTPSNSFLDEDGKTKLATESTTKLLAQTTESSNYKNRDVMDGFLDTTTKVEETTTLLPTGTELNAETHDVTESTDTTINDNVTLQNDAETTTPTILIHQAFTTPTTFDTSEMNTTAQNDVETTQILLDIAETTTILYNETTETELAETVFVTAASSTIVIDTTINSGITESTTNFDLSNSSVESNNTENLELLLTTPEPMNITDELTTYDNISLSTINPETNDTESEEMLENVTLIDSLNSTNYNSSSDETYTSTTVDDFTFPTPPTYLNESAVDNTTESLDDSLMFTTTGDYNETLFSNETDSNSTDILDLAYEDPFGMNSTFLAGWNETADNNTFIDEDGNFTTVGYDLLNETTTNASTGVECREDQFLCEPLNKCINETFMCDGIEDCPDGNDEFECKDSCHSNFMCANSSTCIMSEAHCDGIWDCENGTDEDNCTPTECAKHEVMCLDGSKCIKPGDICDWKYDCLDRSDEVGCVERTTCESSGRFFCNDGLCIPWSLKCDGEHDCKEGEDEGNCTCLSDEFQCNDGKCLKSSSRCDGHMDCHDADDEMGCVTVDSQHIVSTYEPYSGTWGLLCAEDWNLDDGQYLCQELGFGHALSVERIHVSFNGTWMAMRRENLTESSLWTERVSFVESCTSGLAATVECQKFACGEFSGLLHRRRRRDIISSSSTQWPFIGYTSTFHSNKGCLSEILTPIWLITSADCLLSISKQPFNGSDWYVQTNIGRDVEAGVAENHEVLRIINHPHSSKFRSLTLRDYDVALVRLKHALVFVSDKIGAICPPDEQVPPGITCFSGVLGTEKPRAPPPPSLAINYLALQIIDKRNCNRVDHYNNAINQRMLCTQSSEGHTICDNDEGTPLMCLTGINKWFLAGMLTYQRFCDVYSKHPAVFSNLFSMRKFLDQVTGQKQYEVPYDSNVYVIIPPTTPSPTMPETTTPELTTIGTTDLILFNTTDLTTLDAENATETIFDNFEEINGTSGSIEELDREENYTTVFPQDFTSSIFNTTDEVYDIIPYLASTDTAITTVKDLELKDEIPEINRTHSHLMTLSNDTDFSNENFVTNLSTMDNNTEFDNITSIHSLETTTVSLVLRNQPLASDVKDTLDTTTELRSDEATVTTVMNLDLKNETTYNLLDETTTAYSMTSSATSDGTDITGFTTLNFSDSTSADLPVISSFNDTMEMFKPVLSNRSIGRSEPLVAIMDDTTETEIPTTMLSSELLENNTDITITETVLNKYHDSTFVTDITKPPKTDIGTTIPPTTEIETTMKPTTETDTMPPTTEVETTLLSTTEIETTFPSTTDIGTSVSSTAEIGTSVPSTTEIGTSVSSTTENETSVPSASEIGTSVPSITEIGTSVPSTTEIGTSVSSTTEIGTSLPSTTEIGTSVPSATEIGTSVPSTSEIGTTVSPTTEIGTTGTLWTSETTTAPISDETETLSFELEGDTDADLAVSVFRNSNGLKFEAYSQAESNDTSGTSIKVTEIQNDDLTTSSPSATETLLSTTPSSFDSDSSLTSPHDSFIPNRRGRADTDLETTVTDNINYTDHTTFEAVTESALLTTTVTDNINYTDQTTFEAVTESELLTTTGTDNINYTDHTTFEAVTESELLTTTVTDNINYTDHTTFEAVTESEILTTTVTDNIYTDHTTFETVTESKISSSGNDENFTNFSETKLETAPKEHEIVKIHLKSEELVILPDNITGLPSHSECGIWENYSAEMNDSKIQGTVKKWPALGYLHMISGSKICSATVLSPKFVIASLNCLTDSDAEVNPEKWIYVGGLHHFNSTIGEFEKYMIDKIIPYPGTSINGQDVALVQVAGEIRMNEFSKSACVAEEEVPTGEKCFITGWNMNHTVDDPEEKSYSVPITIIPPEECSQLLTTTNNYSGMSIYDFICGVHSEEIVPACYMNLGSPLFCLNENKHWNIQGILNVAGPCDNTQAIFTNILSLKQWISKILSNEEILPDKG